MIDIVTSFQVTKDGHQDDVIMFGTVDENNRKIELHYELNSVGSVLMRADDFWGKLLTLRVKNTNAELFIIYGCHLSQQTLVLSSSGMGTLSGSFDCLVKQQSPFEKYDSISFSFGDINKVFPLVNFEVNVTDDDGPLSFSRPAVNQKQYSVNDGIIGSITSQFEGIPFNPCSEIHIRQKKFINLMFSSEKTAEELLGILSRVKLYLEFLLSQEIQLKDVSFTGKTVDDSFHVAIIVTAPILVPHTFVKAIDENSYKYSEEDFFAGLHGWLSNYEKYSQVISIWEKTIYNANVSPDDTFIWRCQAFELLCILTDDIKKEAYSNLAQDQSNPNLRNYLSIVNSKYNITKRSEKYFSDAKDTRDKLTHNNPKKNVTDDQVKNAYSLINHFLPATMSNIMGFKCRLPGLILMPKQQ